MKRYNILIVDDETDNCFLIKEILKDKDRNFFYAYDGEEAVRMCRNNSIDIVLMDLKMPKMNGFEAALKIKENKPNIPIILQTAYAKELRDDTFVFSIVDDIVNKPLRSRELKTRFNKLIYKTHYKIA